MNKNKLKAYAQAARREFIEAVTERAHYYGLKENSIVPCEVKGDFAIINGNAFPRRVDEQRRALEEQVNHKGFSPVMEEIAYTWFNRFAAIRYMELHGFLSHGYRVLSHPEGSSIPEILEKAQHVELSGLDKEEVIKLKMDGTRDEELYSKLLVAECNELSIAMPFLFEHVQDYTELLLPDNLLHSDSIIRKLVSEVDENDWQEIEIIGWLYQFYISEKKDEVIGKVVRSEDIPAATQLFTPNWIVKYLVQNSLGAQWMRTYPDSSLKTKMEYYIEPAEQTDEVKAEIKEITPTTLNPEELSLLDPAGGSGHILVETYDLLKEIYLERGYRKRDIPELILRKNLYGLEIDDRAAQLAGFAVMMKARGDDKNIFDKRIQPNIVSIQESSGIKAEDGFVDLVNLFEHAKTYGSLIRVPEELAEKLPDLRKKIEEGKKGLNKQDLWTGSQYYERILSLVNQAEILSRKYDAVVANPPYMGGKGMNALIKEFAKQEYPDTKSDLFAMFIERGLELTKQITGNIAMITMESWMFLSSYESMRKKLLNNFTVTDLMHMPYDGRGRTPLGINFGTAAIVFQNIYVKRYNGYFICIRYYEIDEKGVPLEFPVQNERFGASIIDDFKKIPGSPIAYWVSDKVRGVFEKGIPFKDIGFPNVGMQTSNNDMYLRLWYEINHTEFNEETSKSPKWIKYLKGGPFRRWYGNLDYLLRYNRNPNFIRKQKNATVLEESKLQAPKCTWTDLTSGAFSARYVPNDTFHDISGHCFYPNQSNQYWLLGFTNTKQFGYFISIINSSFHFQVGDVGKTPILQVNKDVVTRIVKNLIDISKFDWDSFETSWDFSEFPMLSKELNGKAVKESYLNWEKQCRNNIVDMKELEEENNRVFIEAYGLHDELTPEVPINEITLFANPRYRYKGELTDELLSERFRADTMKELISYSVGCMMGRYSLDQKGLVYAHAGNEGFDHNKYKTFPADDDGIVPITDHEWFDDDAPCRFFKLIETAWDKDTLEDNLDYIVDGIGRKTNESSRDSIRKYFVNEFFKDHLKTYKKRPIYWLFTSGKEKAFQALVYLHRYNGSTLSRMRTEYVLPLQSKITTRMEHLGKDKDHATSTSAANKIQKEIGKLRKQKEELLKFDEKLRHHANMKITLDLDDGVKVNYGKFGDLLAEVKAVTGKR